jgi:cytochrome bd-type quinol oxidase subunit 2
MRNFRFFTQKILLVCLLLVFIIEIIQKQNPFGLLTFLCLVAIFLIESAYYIFENTNKEIQIFSAGNKSQHRKNSIILMLLSLLAISAHCYEVGFTLLPNLSMTILLILGLRGLLFTNQTVESIRVFKQGIEYGFWTRFVSWKRIQKYSTDSNCVEIYLDKKQIILRFANSNDLTAFVDILKTKNLKQNA